MKKICFVIALVLAQNIWAGVFKCGDEKGHIHYQSSPCTEEHNALKINPKTGGILDIDAQHRQEILATEQRKQQELKQLEAENAKIAALTKTKEEAIAESKLTQALIKQNPLQFSAFAIPVYDPDNLPALVKPFADKLPEIERYRRLAAQKALATGKCQRVEADELNAKSNPNELVFLINCSSAASFYYNQSELN